MGGPKSASHRLHSESAQLEHPSETRREPSGSAIVRAGHGATSALTPPPIPRELRREPAQSGPVESSSSSIEIPLGVDEQGTPRPVWASLPPPVLSFARYGILGRLAVGGMAEIFLAREQIQGDAARHLAIKVLRNQLGGATPDDEAYFESMFLREGRVAMQLSHPNICHTYEFGKFGGHFFIAMEWIEGLPVGGLLERAVRHGTHIPLDVALYITAQVAAALEHAHAARDAQRQPLGVVHRDVTPHNIMLRYDGVVKLLDFGVAKAEQSDEASESGTVKGKFGYMAPEHCLGLELDGRADVFSLGVCLFEMLTAKRLYRRGSQYETSRAIVEEPPPSVYDYRADLPEGLDAILARALAKQPEERLDAAGFMEALVALASACGFVLSATRARRWLEDSYGEDLYRGPMLEVDPAVLARLEPIAHHPTITSSAPPAGGATPSALAPRRSPWGWLALGGALALLLAGALWWWTGAGVPAPAPTPQAGAIRPSTPSVVGGGAAEVAPAVEAPPSPVAVPSAVESVPTAGGPPPGAPSTEGVDAPVGSGEPRPSVRSEGREPARQGAPARRPGAKPGRRPGFVADPGF